MSRLKLNTHESVAEYIRNDFIALNQSITIDEAIQQIRALKQVNRPAYIYAVNDHNKLVGVIQTRDIIMAQGSEILESIMNRRVIAIPESATIFDACEFFVMYKHIGYPVVNKEKEVIGVIDINMLTDELLDFAERQKVNDVFESIGFRMQDVRNANIFKAWKIRFPWLLSTIASGTLCAFVAGVFEQTLAQSITLAFFLTLVLGLGESLSIQSMTLTVQRLHSQKPTRKWLTKALFKELKIALLIGLASAFLVGMVVLTWKGFSPPVYIIPLSIVVSLLAASGIGILIPSVLHAFNMDPKIASGPVTLALADLFTISTYMTLGYLLI